MSEVYVPPYIYCPRCGNKVMLTHIKGDELEKIREHGYIAGARGVCECGVVMVLCVQELPKSPTFSLFFDVYKVPRSDTRRAISSRSL